MTADEFAKRINESVSESAIGGTIVNLTDPPGQKPDPELVMLSNWYAALSENDKAAVNSVIRMAAGSAVFGFCCVLDGVRFLEPGSEAGEFELYYVKSEQRIRINDPKQEELHNLFNWYRRDRFKTEGRDTRSD